MLMRRMRHLPRRQHRLVASPQTPPSAESPAPPRASSRHSHSELHWHLVIMKHPRHGHIVRSITRSWNSLRLRKHPSQQRKRRHTPHKPLADSNHSSPLHSFFTTLYALLSTLCFTSHPRQSQPPHISPAHRQHSLTWCTVPFATTESCLPAPPVPTCHHASNSTVPTAHRITSVC